MILINRTELKHHYRLDITTDENLSFMPPLCVLIPKNGGEPRMLIAGINVTSSEFSELARHINIAASVFVEYERGVEADMTPKQIADLCIEKYRQWLAKMGVN